jgi:hypothetical protein
MPELARKLAAVSEAAENLRAVEDEYEPRLAEARAKFQDALIEAHNAGASYGLLGRVVGLSRQRVARIVSG